MFKCAFSSLQEYLGVNALKNSFKIAIICALVVVIGVCAIITIDSRKPNSDKFFTVTWANYDGTILSTKKVASGSTPTFDGDAPKKPSDSQYSYTFSGWLPAIGKIYQDTTYVAQYESQPNTDNSPQFSSVLPTFYINTNGKTLPDRDDPDYKNYAQCEIGAFNGESLLFNEIVSIRIRGTSSRWFAKKGYKIKFSSQKTLLGLPSSKKYNLIASYPDPCKLRDYLALSISHTMNTNSNRYAPQPILSKVYIDNDYNGLYLFIDNISSGDGKIELEQYNKTDVEIPFIIEMDTLAYQEGVEGVNYFALGTTDVFDYDGDGWTDLLYVIDSEDNPTEAQFAYIQNYVSSCRQALVDKNLTTFSELVDVNAFIDYFLLGELFRNTDMAGRSVYMYRQSKDGKLIFGPSWDFDYTCSRPYKLGPNTDYTLENAKDRFTNYDWWKLFLDIPEAQELIKARYTNYLKGIYLSEIDKAKQYYQFYEAEIKADAEVWYKQKVSDTDTLVEDNFKWTCDYFELRLEMMDELFLITENR